MYFAQLPLQARMIRDNRVRQLAGQHDEAESIARRKLSDMVRVGLFLTLILSLPKSILFYPANSGRLGHRLCVVLPW